MGLGGQHQMLYVIWYSDRKLQVLSLTACSECDVMQNCSYCLALLTVILVDFMVDKQAEDYGWYYLGYQMDNY